MLRDAFECQKCGIAREQVAYCQNPACEDARAPQSRERTNPVQESQIITTVKMLFDNTVTPGQAFDALVAMRREGVVYEDVVTALIKSGKSLDVDDDTAEPGPLTRPASSYLKPTKAWPRQVGTTPVRQATPAKFKNPKLSFGSYANMTLTQVMKINPGYVNKLAEGAVEGIEGDFWKEQARLAKIAVAADAPAYKDTESSGFLS